LACVTRFRYLLALSVLLPFISLTFSLACAQAQVVTNNDPYKKWLREDVRWIISDQERADFKKLSDHKQRDQFIEAFWERRSPSPGEATNLFKEEHYRRIAYVNEHLATRIIPGWKTDRGRFYIMYGPPDKIVRQLVSGNQQPDVLKSDVSSEEWHWIYIEGLGCDVVLEFVDTCGCGEYHLSEGQGGFRSLRELGSTCLVDQILLPD
jgi:GWxTD domain-containing protein